MSNATVLQTAANRFSHVAGFAPLVVDGVIGTRTLSAVQRALDYISVSGVDDGIAEVISDQAAAWGSGARTLVGLTASAQAIGAFLSYVADQLKLGFVASPMPTAPQLPMVPPTASPIGPATGAASITDAWRALATWKKIALGAFAGFFLIFLHGRLKKSRGLGGSQLYLLKRRRASGGLYEISRVKH